eukprot:s157_g35.t1
MLTPPLQASDTSPDQHERRHYYRVNVEDLELSQFLHQIAGPRCLDVRAYCYQRGQLCSTTPMSQLPAKISVQTFEDSIMRRMHGALSSKHVTKGCKRDGRSYVFVHLRKVTKWELFDEQREMNIRLCNEIASLKKAMEQIEARLNSSGSTGSGAP